tara:strand:+ start:301 stop:501 length:201 start_codon:yes stop_codon:yes gene_type:complete
MASKDQRSIEDTESKDQKWNRGLDICIESIHKADHALRGCAHNQKCFHEMMEIRDNILQYAQTLRR